MVDAYIKATEDNNDLYRNTDVVPPMAVATLAMTALSEHISLPPGAVHVSQEFEFANTVKRQDSLTSYSKVVKKHKRGQLHLLAIELNVVNDEQKPVLTGKLSFILPR